MKKITDTKLAVKFLSLKWYFRLAFLILPVVLIVCVILLLILGIGGDDRKYPDQELGRGLVQELDSVSSGYRLFESEDGLLGVEDAYGRCILTPEWEHIDFLNSGRFAAAKGSDKGTFTGIIDSSGNCILPFMLKKLVPAGKYMLLGYAEDTGDILLMDTSGNIISDRTWDEYSFDEQTETVKMTSGGTSFLYGISDGKPAYKAAVFSGRAAGCDISFTADEESSAPEITADRTESMFRALCVYFDCAFSNDPGGIKPLTNGKYFEYIAENGMFKNCTAVKIENISLNYYHEETESYIMSAEVLYDYKDGENTANGLRALATLSFVYDENLSLLLKSVNKEEL